MGILSSHRGKKKKVPKLARRRDEFMSLAAHELKTPITTLNLYAQLLKERLLLSRDKETLSMLANIEQQSARLVKLVNDLLTVNSIEVGKLSLHEEEFEIGRLASKIARVIGDANGTRINVKSPRQIIVRGDPDRIEEVLVNLLSNAVKYSRQSRKIAIRITRGRDNALIGVEDSGPGIPKEDQKAIFMRFYRGMEEGARVAGFGLGLYISSEIIKRHRQKIWVESKLGKGSTFYFTLPMAK